MLLKVILVQPRILTPHQESSSRRAPEARGRKTASGSQGSSRSRGAKATGTPAEARPKGPDEEKTPPKTHPQPEITIYRAPNQYEYNTGD